MCGTEAQSKHDGDNAPSRLTARTNPAVGVDPYLSLEEEEAAVDSQKLDAFVMLAACGC